MRQQRLCVFEVAPTTQLNTLKENPVLANAFTELQQLAARFLAHDSELVCLNHNATECPSGFQLFFSAYFNASTA
jgi:hypothetical protein